MKKTLLLLLVTTSIYAQGLKDTLIDMKFYKVLYSQKLENPIKVDFFVYKPVHEADRKGMAFKPYHGVVTSTDADYVHNDYDKGHMASAESFAYSHDAMLSTFNYINSGIQNFALNRGTWKSLEQHERQLAQTDTVYVTCGALFLGTKIAKLASGASIPTHFYKILKVKGIKKYYLFPNSPCDKDFNKYEVVNDQFLKL